MLGIELNKDCGELVSMALEHKLLINVNCGENLSVYYLL